MICRICLHVIKANDPMTIAGLTTVHKLCWEKRREKNSNEGSAAQQPKNERSAGQEERQNDPQGKAGSELGMQEGETQ